MGQRRFGVRRLASRIGFRCVFTLPVLLVGWTDPSFGESPQRSTDRDGPTGQLSEPATPSRPVERMRDGPPNGSDSARQRQPGDRPGGHAWVPAEPKAGTQARHQPTARNPMMLIGLIVAGLGVAVWLWWRREHQGRPFDFPFSYEEDQLALMPLPLYIRVAVEIRMFAQRILPERQRTVDFPFMDVEMVQRRRRK